MEGSTLVWGSERDTVGCLTLLKKRTGIPDTRQNSSDEELVFCFNGRIWRIQKIPKSWIVFQTSKNHIYSAVKKVDVWCGFSIILSWRDFQKFPPKVSASATVTGSAPSVGLVFARPKGASTKKNTKDAGVPPHYSFDTLIWGEVDANTTTCHTPAVYTLARANIDASPWPNLHFGICVGPCLRAITRRTMNQLNLKIIAWMGRIP